MPRKNRKYDVWGFWIGLLALVIAIIAVILSWHFYYQTTMDLNELRKDINIIDNTTKNIENMTTNIYEYVKVQNGFPLSILIFLIGAVVIVICLLLFGHKKGTNRKRQSGASHR